MKLVEYFRYVPHYRRAAYEATGWVWAAEMYWPHGYWAVLMRWDGDGEPREP